MQDQITAAGIGPLASANDGAGRQRQLGIRFSGSGSEYFRIWIVNLLLTIITLGIYYPWARVRKLRYFYANTLVDGDALAFHGNPKSMFRGYALIAVLGLAYSALSNLSPLTSVLALVALFAVGPLLWRAGLQFRLANTSWRGLRFHFTGSSADAYQTQLPILLPLLAVTVIGAIAGFSSDMGAGAAPQAPGGWLLLGLGLAPLVLIAGSAYSFWRMKRYQHSNYALGQLQTRFDAGFGLFVSLFLKGIGLFLLVGFALGAMAGLGAAVFGLGMGTGKGWVFFLIALFYFVLMAALLSTLKPWLVTRLQNLVWNHTGCDQLQFHSDLKVSHFIGLSVKNWLLILCTLGFYWPFAAIATTRLRVEAVSIDLTVEADSLSGKPLGSKVGAAGEAAGDLFGLNVGL